MKKFLIFIVIVSVVVCFSACKSNETARLELPDSKDIISISVTSDEKSVTIVDKNKINDLFQKFSEISEKTDESYNDSPSAESFIKIEFETSKGKSSNTIYFYQEDKESFVEQPYNGIYLVDETLHIYLNNLIME